MTVVYTCRSIWCGLLNMGEDLAGSSFARSMPRLCFMCCTQQTWDSCAGILARLIVLCVPLGWVINNAYVNVNISGSGL